jgi:hypothetical protein
MSLIRDLGQLVADISFERLPAVAVDVARTGFADCVAHADRPMSKAELFAARARHQSCFSIAPAGSTPAPLGY